MSFFAVFVAGKVTLCRVEKSIEMSKPITHEGVVIKTEGDQVHVMIVQHSACSGCHARGACMASDKKEKIIIAESLGKVYAPGERVMLIGTNSMAWSALFYAFLLPMVLCMTVLFAVGLTLGESMAALAVLGVLALYYAVLAMFRKKLNTRFTFTLRRLGNES